MHVKRMSWWQRNGPNDQRLPHLGASVPPITARSPEPCTCCEGGPTQNIQGLGQAPLSPASALSFFSCFSASFDSILVVIDVESQPCLSQKCLSKMFVW